MSTPRGVRTRWLGPTAVLLVALLAAAAVLLVARDNADLKAQRDVRAATANAATPVSDAMRTAMSKASSGTAAGTKRVALADSPDVGVSRAVATRARDSGIPVLEDSGEGIVVVATYDTPSKPATVEERRQHVTGLRVSSLDLRSTLNALRPPRGGISLTGPRRTIDPCREHVRSDNPSYDVTLQPGPVQVWTLTLWTKSPRLPGWAWLAALGIVVLGAVAAGWLVRRGDQSRRRQRELKRLQETSAVTAAMATVAQHSMDLADLLPALTNELATALGLRGLSLGAPTPDGDREFFAWGVPPAPVPAVLRVAAKVLAGETLCLTSPGAGGPWRG